MMHISYPCLLRFVYVLCTQGDVVCCRRQQLHEHDLVNKLQLSTFAKEKVQRGAQVHGHKFGQAMQTIDTTISQQLQRMITR